MSFINLYKPFDPLQDAIENEAKVIRTNIEIRLIEKTSRSKITRIEGLTNIDLKQFIKDLQPILSCSGSIIDDPKKGQVIHFQGNHIEFIAKYLIKKELANKSQIRIH